MSGLAIVGIAALVIFVGGLLLGVSAVISLSVTTPRRPGNWIPPQFREPRDRWPGPSELPEPDPDPDEDEEVLRDTPSWPDSGFRI